MSALRWIEQLDANHEVVRVARLGSRYLFRVVAHRNASWRAEHRACGHWFPFLGAPRGGAVKWATARIWRSPEAAMRFVESIPTTLVSSETPKEGT